MQTATDLKFRIGFLFIVVLAFSTIALAAAIDGAWTATFDTRGGEQHYTYTLKAAGEKLTGTAKNDRGETTIEEGVIKGDDISFTENLDFQGRKISVKYTGKLNGDEIKFTRQVGDFGSKEFVAKRKK